MKFHVNKTTGTVGVCRAKKECPFGDLATEHYSTRSEAAKVFEQMMNQNVVAVGVEKDALKEMDANDLAFELFKNLARINADHEQFSDFLELVSILHAGQSRRNRGPHAKTPYIEHPLRVTNRLLRWGVTDISTIQAAMFHDTVEDCAKFFVRNFTDEKADEELECREILLDFIGDNCGDKTRETVHGLTNAHVSPERKKVRTVQEKNQEYFDHVQKNIKDANVFLVKLSDFFDNAGSLHYTDTPDNERVTKRQAVKYLPVCRIFKMRLLHKDLPLSQDKTKELYHRVEKIESRLTQLIEKYESIE